MCAWRDHLHATCGKNAAVAWTVKLSVSVLPLNETTHMGADSGQRNNLFTLSNWFFTRMVSLTCCTQNVANNGVCDKAKRVFTQVRKGCDKVPG